MPVDYSSLPKDSLVLVTGANGFLGSHIAHALLQAGHRVRGTVRSPAKCAWLRAHFDAAHGPGRFSLVPVPDMAAPAAFVDAVRGVDAVAHVASVMGDLCPDPNAVIPVVVRGVTNALDAAAGERRVKAFVYTSSSTAAYSPKPGAGGDVGQETWNEETVKEAWAPPPYEPSRTGKVYGASKMAAEKAVWDWVKEKEKEGEVGFRVNAVLPNVNFGRSLDVKNQGHPTTSGWAFDLATGKLADRMWEAVKPQYYVNVEDTALIHVAALTRPDIDRQRIYAFAGEFNWNTLLHALRKLYPERTFYEDREGLGHDLSRIVDAGKAEELLKDVSGRGWKSLEESLKENLEDLGW
ncbi:hypothetical protein SLS57_003154 [Botryosphaeria dothidea]